MSTTEPAYQLLREENERLRARRGRCDKHKDMAGPSLYHDCCESERLRELCREQADENERLRGRCERLGGAVKAVEALIADSYGVAGLHLNGDAAPWDTLRTGGYFEDWLKDFDAALDAMEGGG